MKFASTEDIYALFRECAGVTTDSRKVSRGDMFFALKGDNFDGNKYASSALDAGAVWCVVDDPSAVISERCLLVEDALSSLQDLAREHRRVLGIPILAITGSSGKTTTKELVSRVLSRKFKVSVTQGNLNNHIGVPLTLLRMDGATEIGIVEMGASHQKEIELLCSIARPDYGLITNIGRAHLEGFGGVEGVEKGKGELLDYLAANGGIAFYLSDSEALRRMVAARTALKSTAYSASTFKNRETEQGLSFEWKGRVINSALVGDYNLYNIAAAIVVGEHFGVNDSDIAMAIGDYVPDNNRSQSVESGSNRLILDYYNANPSSMRAAVEAFASMPTSRERVAVLGDMLELGEYSAMEHRAILSLLKEKGVKRAMLVGPAFGGVKDEVTGGSGVAFVGTEGDGVSAGNSYGNGPDTEHGYMFFPDTAALAAYLKDNPLSRSLVLIKGSRGMHLEDAVPLLAGK